MWRIQHLLKNPKLVEMQEHKLHTLDKQGTTETL